MNQEIIRCPWDDTKDEAVQEYHDHEWCKLNLDESHLYEMLVLELFQSGLSWSTVLHKRDNFKAAFKNWQISEVAKMTDKDIESLMQNKGIIRNRMKINAAVKNARAFWQLNKNIVQSPNIYKILYLLQLCMILPALMTFPLLMTYRKDIQTNEKDGFSFVGPVVIYSYLQGIGLINDHLNQCQFKFHG